MFQVSFIEKNFFKNFQKFFLFKIVQKNFFQKFSIFFKFSNGPSGFSTPPERGMSQGPPTFSDT